MSAPQLGTLLHGGGRTADVVGVGVGHHAVVAAVMGRAHLSLNERRQLGGAGLGDRR